MPNDTSYKEGLMHILKKYNEDTTYADTHNYENFLGGTLCYVSENCFMIQMTLFGKTLILEMY